MSRARRERPVRLRCVWPTVPRAEPARHARAALLELMPWDTTRPPDAKYRTREHRELRAHYVRRIKAGEALECTAAVCLFDRAPITNPNGNAKDGLHLGHNDDGVTYAGPQHNACNVHDAAVRGNERSPAGRAIPSTRWVL